MNIKITITALLLLSVFTSSAQTDTIYFDKDWVITPDRSQMQYYRLYKSTGDNTYGIKDYYGNGVLQMEGNIILSDDKYIQYATSDDYSKTGKFVYYQFNGKKSSEGIYEKDQKHGEWMEYYDTLGTIEYLKNYTYGLLHGVFKSYYNTGELYSVYKYQKGDIEGAYISYYKNGMISKTGHYKDSEKDGEHKIYYPSGELKGTLKYDAGKIVSDKVLYYPNGKTKLKTAHKEGRLTTSICYDMDGNSMPCAEVFKIKDTISVRFNYLDTYPMPDYDVSQYLSDNLKYPKKAKNNNIEGRVLVRFVVDEQGAIIDVESITTEIDKSLQEEAVRVVTAMPKWKPGEQDGVPVKVFYTLPVRFTLDDNKKKMED